MSIAELYENGEQGSFMQSREFSDCEKQSILSIRPDAYFSVMLDEFGEVIAETVNFPKVVSH